MYEILYDPDVEKQLDRLPDKVYERIDEAILKLAENPRPHGSTKLVQHKDIHRIRVGEYRVIYTVLDEDKVVIIAKVARRSKRTYRDI